MTGQPLFPGDSDIDQLYRIMKCLGQLTRRHMDVFMKNPLYVGLKLPDASKPTKLENKLPNFSPNALALIQKCLIYDPDKRASCEELMKMPYFSENKWSEQFEAELVDILAHEKGGDASKRSKQTKKTPEASDSAGDAAANIIKSVKLNETEKPSSKQSRPKTGRGSRSSLTELAKPNPSEHDSTSRPAQQPPSPQTNNGFSTKPANKPSPYIKSNPKKSPQSYASNSNATSAFPLPLGHSTKKNISTSSNTSSSTNTSHHAQISTIAGTLASKLAGGQSYADKIRTMKANENGFGVHGTSFAGTSTPEPTYIAQQKVPPLYGAAAKANHQVRALPQAVQSKMPGLNSRQRSREKPDQHGMLGGHTQRLNITVLNDHK